MISESPACLNCPNGIRGSFAGPLVKSTYVKLTGNALPFLVTYGVSSALSQRFADYSDRIALAPLGIQSADDIRGSLDLIRPDWKRHPWPWG